jgi:hypothetical protein
MFQAKTLDASTFTDFEFLVHQRFQAYLKVLDRQTELLAVGVEDFLGLPGGIALAHLLPDQNRAELFYIWSRRSTGGKGPGLACLKNWKKPWLREGLPGWLSIIRGGYLFKHPWKIYS